jgi:hypothetical protein
MLHRSPNRIAESRFCGRSQCHHFAERLPVPGIDPTCKRWYRPTACPRPADVDSLGPHIDSERVWGIVTRKMAISALAENSASGPDRPERVSSRLFRTRNSSTRIRLRDHLYGRQECSDQNGNDRRCTSEFNQCETPLHILLDVHNLRLS